MTTQPISHQDLLNLLDGAWRITWLPKEDTIVILYGYKPSAQDVLVDADCKKYLDNNRRFLTDSSAVQRWLSATFLRGYVERQLVQSRLRKLRLLIGK